METKGLLEAERPNTANIEYFVKGRTVSTSREAACLLAGETIRNGELSGVADGYLYDLRKKIVSGGISNTNADIDFALQLRGFRSGGSAVERMSNMSSPIIDDPVISRCEISKSDLGKLAETLGRTVPRL